MKKLEGGTGFVRISGTPYQKGTLRVYISGDNVEIREVGSNHLIVASTKFDQFENASNVAYTSLTALKTDIETLFFTT